MIIAQIMTHEPITATPDWTLSKAFQAIYEGDFRHLPVVDRHGELKGMLSSRDMERALLPAVIGELTHGQPAELFEQTVGEFMVGDVLTLSTEDEIPEAIELMVSHRVGALPVVDPHTGMLLGIVSYVDVLRAAREYF